MSPFPRWRLRHRSGEEKGLRLDAVIRGRRGDHIDTDEDAVRIEVVDCDPAHLPQLLPPDPARFGGIGLHVVNDVARRWGYEVDAASKTVWFEIEDTYQPLS